MNQNGNSFKGKNFIITGGTQGLGRRIALDLASQGAAGVLVCGRNAERGEAVQKELNSEGCRGIFVQADLQFEKDCRSVAADAVEAFGGIHGLVNAAGITNRGGIEDTDVELWDLMMNINTRAPFLLMQDVVRQMKKQGIHGSIVNILSDQIHGGAPYLTPYSASKGALATLTKNVANSVLRDQIRVNGIAIGWMDTPAEHQTQVSQGRPENWLEEAEAEKPFKRLLKPYDVSGLVCYLLSGASTMMTGAIIDFDQKVIGCSD